MSIRLLLLFRQISLFVFFLVTTIPSLLSYYLNALLPISPILYRPNGDSKGYYYHAMDITVFTSGTYSLSITSSIGTMSYLFDTSFDPSNLSMNLINMDDNSLANREVRMGVSLQSGRKYILVVPTAQPSITAMPCASVPAPPPLLITSTMPSTGKSILYTKLVFYWMCYRRNT